MSEGSPEWRTMPIPEIGNGIIYCSGKNKGDKLKEFFKKIQHLPTHIACFDDKGSHLEDGLKVAIQSQVRFNGWRYGFLDEKIKAFDIKIAHQQLALIKHRLPLHVQEAVERLKSIQGNHEMTLSPAHCFHGFFNNDATAHPHPREQGNRQNFRRHHNDSSVDYTKEQDIAKFDF